MKLASYVTDGKPAFGVVSGDGVITLNDRLSARHVTLRDALAAGALDEIRRTAQSLRPDRKLSDIRFLPAIPNPEKILCVGINYKSHAAEQGHEAPKLPNIFTRFVNTLVAHEGEMIRPKVSTSFDFEGELAVIIGRGGRHISQENALAHVAGRERGEDRAERDDRRDRVDQHVGAGMLHLGAVETGGQRERRRIGDFVCRHDPGAERT